MSPFTIDEEKFRKQEVLDLTKPQGTAQGLPVKQIPHMEFPKVVYKHPKERYREIIHRNVNHEIVERELVPAEHLTLLVNNEEELKKALREGWVKEPYIMQPLPDPNAELYEAPQAKGK